MGRFVETGRSPHWHLGALAPHAGPYPPALRLKGATWLTLVQKSGPAELGKARSSFQSFLDGGIQTSQHRQLRCTQLIVIGSFALRSSHGER